jgi:hypothetical protein
MAEIRGATKLGIRVDGLPELQAQFNKLGKMPKKYLTKAGREGIADTERQMKAAAPKGKTGLLKRSIKKKMETPNKRNKGVYRLRYDPKFNNNFQKPTTGKYGGKTPYAYYPSSVEYGYLGEKGHVKVKTMYWAEKIVRSNQNSSMKKVIDSLNDSIDTLLKSR